MAKTPMMAKLLKQAAKMDDAMGQLSDEGIGEKNILCPMEVPLLNIANSGRIDGGLVEGIKMIVGDSRCYKSGFLVMDAVAFLKHDPEAIVIFADSEKGASKPLWEQYGADMDRVLYTPVYTVEDMIQKVTQLLDMFEPGQKVMLVIDSLGLLASNKEKNDALAGESKADFTRAKAINSFWRITLGYVNHLRMPVSYINRGYDDMANQYAELIIGGGKNTKLSADVIWNISRSQIKEGKELVGWSFNIGIYKSRHCVEKVKLPVEIFYDGGIAKWSGLLEIARLLGFVDMPSSGWYAYTEKAGFGTDVKKHRKADMDADFWMPLLENPDFIDAVNARFELHNKNRVIMTTEDVERLTNMQADD